jgi:hypothetical protein
VGKSEGKRPVGARRGKLVDNIEPELRSDGMLWAD